MSEMTVTVDPRLARDLLSDALDADAAAHAAGDPAALPPPKVPWLHEDGSPKYGTKPDGTPRRSRPGTGRPKADPADKPRTSEQPPAPAREPGPARDYGDDIGAALTMAWMGLAAVPLTRAHAAVLKQQIPAMTPAWNAAAQQNAGIRRYVEKLSGSGSWGWVIPVTVTTAPLLAGFWQVTRDGGLRSQLAAKTEAEFGAFIMEQARAAGLELPEPEPEPEPAGAGGAPAE